MTLKASTGLRNALLDSSDLKTQLDGGLIKVYDGAIPATADDSIGSSTLLLVYSLNSTGSGISFDTAASSGALSKAPGEVWAGNGVATGTATYYRHVAVGDTGGASTTEPRLQGGVGVAGAELNLVSTSIVSAVNRVLDYYSVSAPTL